MHVLSHQQFDFMLFVHPISNQRNDLQLSLLTTKHIETLVFSGRELEFHINV